MLSRYTMKRGVPAAQLPEGIRQDTRKHTRHVLRPTPDMVASFLAADLTWDEFAAAYREIIDERFRADRDPFDELAETARGHDVYLGCSCPTKKNPDVRHCHTWLALEFMRDAYPDLAVRFPR